MSILLKDSVASLRKSITEFIGVIKQRIDKIPIDSRNYLCFTASTASASVTLIKQGSPVNLVLEYSTDRIHWHNFVIGQTYTLAKAGDSMWIRNVYDTQYENSAFSSQNYYYFSFTGYIKASGNIMSLLYRSFESATTLPIYCFYRLFAGCPTLETAPELPATTLSSYCYANMFSNCRSLREAPALPALNLASYCYRDMFNYCYSLQVAPALPSTTMAEGCYENMFYGCSALKMPPLLKATSLAPRCYQNMFSFCRSLDLSNSPTSENWHPEIVFTLPATTLAINCYANMFIYCTSLTEMPKISATTVADYCCQNMFAYCKNLKKVYDLPATTMALYCYRNMYRDCTSLEFPPALPATTLANDCYEGMFRNCTSLKYFKTENMSYNSIYLPATTMAKSCYQQMFLGCTSLTSAPTLNGTTLATGCYNEMFSGCGNLKYVKTVTKDLTSTYANNWLQNAGHTGVVVCPHDDTQTVVPNGWVKADYANLHVYDAKPSNKTFVDEKNLPDGAKLAILPGTDRFALYCSRSNHSTETKTFHFVLASDYWDTGINYANIMLAPNETVVSDGPQFIIVSPLVSGKKNNCMIWFDGADSSKCFLYTLSVEDL